MADELILLDIKVLPCSFVKEIISNAWRVMLEAVEKKEGRLVMGFKVIGENRLLAIFHQGSDSALKFLNAAYGNHLSVSSTRLRSFDAFSNHVLGCQNAVKRQSINVNDLLNSPGKLFWVKYKIDYLGNDLSSFINKWAKEANFWIDLKQRGELHFEIFKVLAQREVHMFIRTQSPDLLDDLLFTTPLNVLSGNQIDVAVKSVKFFNESITTNTTS